MNKLLLKIIVFLYVFINSVQTNGLENKIIFKLEGKSFTTVDIENRKIYLEFIGDNKELNKNEIIKDYTSALIFNRYYQDNNFNFELEDQIQKIYNEIFDKISKLKKLDAMKNKELIFNNLRLDLIRKNLLEIFLNSEKEEIFSEGKDIDLIYKFRIIYINIYLSEFEEYIDEFNSINFKNVSEIESYLDSKKIVFFKNIKEIKNINNVNKLIRDNLNSGINLFKIKKNNRVSIVYIDKNFETYDGLIAKIYSFTTNKKLKKDKLICKKLDVGNITNREYEFEKLNDEIKNNLININDFVEIKNNDSFTYIILCDIKFNKELLNNLNINKKINSKVNYIENNFINKFSIYYNLKINNE